MKLITKSYKLFGRQCKFCGAYFVYTPADALASPCCPACFAPFTHSIDDPSVDLDPDVKELKAQQAVRGAAEDSVILPEFSVGQSVYALARKTTTSSWYYYGIVTIQKIIYVADEKATKLYYLVSDTIEGTNTTLEKIKVFATKFDIRLSNLLASEVVDSLPAISSENVD